jgi:hypothetical protein
VFYEAREPPNLAQTKNFVLRIRTTPGCYEWLQA